MLFWGVILSIKGPGWRVCMVGHCLIGSLERLLNQIDGEIENVICLQSLSP